MYYQWLMHVIKSKAIAFAVDFYHRYFEKKNILKTGNTKLLEEYYLKEFIIKFKRKSKNFTFVMKKIETEIHL